LHFPDSFVPAHFQALFATFFPDLDTGLLLWHNISKVTVRQVVGELDPRGLLQLVTFVVVTIEHSPIGKVERSP